MISIVDDDESIRAATKALLRSFGYEVETFASAELFLASGALRQTECLVLDVRMPGIDGLELQRRLNSAKSRVPIVFVTAHDDRAHRNKAMEAGAVNFFRKPFDANVFVAAIRVALRRGAVSAFNEVKSVEKGIRQVSEGIVANARRCGATSSKPDGVLD
jgi:FixJ family two-component response regulator